MKKCEEGEHLWIVIGWSSGIYDDTGKFVRRHAASTEDFRAREFMCQRCTEKRSADSLLLSASS